MRAHVLHRYGRSNAVHSFTEHPTPALGAHDARIDVEAASLHPVDVKTREGEPKMLLPFAPPFVLGCDLAGRVVEVGADVSTLQVGDSVYAYAGMDRMGAFAESVVLPASRIARRPAGLSPSEAACLPLAGLCALSSLDAGGVAAGSRVLVHGGAGGVGRIAVQLAARRGAEVFATAGARDVERLHTLGAAHTIDYGRERFEDVAREIDFVLDTVGGETLARSFGTLRRGGTLASLHVPPPTDTLAAAGLRTPWLLRALLPFITRKSRVAADRRGVRLIPVLSVPAARVLDTLASLASARPLDIPIDREFPFPDLAAAFDHLTSGQARGRVVLTRG